MFNNGPKERGGCVGRAGEYCTEGFARRRDCGRGFGMKWSEVMGLLSRMDAGTEERRDASGSARVQ